MIPSLTLALLAACGPGPSTDRALTVFAASSLTESFEALARDFETSHPGVDVQVTFSGSQVLRLQLEHGAQADVFASAHRAHLQSLVDVGVIDFHQPFARNGLAVIVPLDGSITRFDQLDEAERIVVGGPEVPIGRYTATLLANASHALGPPFGERVRRRIVSEEPNVRLVRAKVELGEADAAVVYRSDAASSSSRIRTVEVPDALDVKGTYWVGTVAGSPRHDLAAAFAHYLESAPAQAILGRHGFDAAEGAE